MQPVKFGVGQAVRRIEDDALVRGAGHYVADHAPAGLLHAVVLRSSHAHAGFRITDAAGPRLPGSPGADRRRDRRPRRLACLGLIPDTTIAIVPSVLARDLVRHVGVPSPSVADTIGAPRCRRDRHRVAPLPHVTAPPPH